MEIGKRYWMLFLALGCAVTFALPVVAQEETGEEVAEGEETAPSEDSLEGSEIMEVAAETTSPVEDSAVPEEAAPVEEPALGFSSELGSLGFGFALQMGADVFPNQVSGKQFGLSVQRARFALAGHVFYKDLTYVIEGDLLSGLGTPEYMGYPGREVLTVDGESEVPVLLTAAVKWHIPKMGIHFKVGRFIPKWGLSMPEEVTNLAAIPYPLYVFGSTNSLGTFRSIGVEAEVALTDHIQLGGGVFNGGRNTWVDSNDRKDILLYASTDFLPGFNLRASSMFVFPTQYRDRFLDGAVVDSSRQDTEILSILEARYNEYSVDAMVGVAHGAFMMDEKSLKEDYMAYGVMAHLGVTVVGDWFQIMARFERWEPDTEMSKDEQMRITAGPQLFIKDTNIQLRINYIQDFFESKAGMCHAHLALPECATPFLPDEAKKQAATILVQLTLSL